jgi:hypothetical protein
MGFVHVDDVPFPESKWRGGRAIHIYALVDPRFDDVRYVGATSRSVETRLFEHIENPTNRRTRVWIRGLQDAGEWPEVVTLQTVSRGWERAEMEWIAWFRARADLLNVDDGGRLFEDGTGWDDIKREKARAYLATAVAHASSARPPTCAQDHRTEGQKRSDRRAAERNIRKAERFVASRNGAELVKRQEKARLAVSIEPRIVRRLKPAAV